MIGYRYVVLKYNITEEEYCSQRTLSKQCTRIYVYNNLLDLCYF